MKNFIRQFIAAFLLACIVCVIALAVIATIGMVEIGYAMKDAKVAEIENRTAGRIVSEQQQAEVLLLPIHQVQEEDVLEMVATFVEMNPSMSRWLAAELTKSVVRESARYGLNPAVVVEIIRHESHGNLFAKNSYTSDGKKHYVYGVMQVSDIHAENLKKAGVIRQFPQDLYTPEGGIASGCYVLWQYLRQYEGSSHALAKYSGGAAYSELVQKMRNSCN
jgi:soluble lytic murein transglycosylase-like protein